MSRRRTVRRRRTREPSKLLWGATLVLLLGVAAGGAYAVYRVVSGRESFDAATLCPEGGPPAAVAVLLDLTDPLRPAQAARLRTFLAHEVERAPTYAMISIGVVGSEETDWGARIALCKPATGAEANPLYENAALLAERFEQEFQAPLEAKIEATLTAEAQDSSPIIEALQALLAETPFADGSDRPLRIVLVSDLLQHSDLLSFYRGESWEALEVSGNASRLAPSLVGADIELVRIPRPEAPEIARLQVDGFWSRYFDRQGAAVPIHETTLGDL